jgi:hypothetical protein
MDGDGGMETLKLFFAPVGCWLSKNDLAPF